MPPGLPLVSLVSIPFRAGSIEINHGTGCSPDVGFVGRGKSGTITSKPFGVRVDGTIVAASK